MNRIRIVRCAAGWTHRAWLGAVCLTVALAACPAPAVIILGSSAGNTSAPGNVGLATRWGQVGGFSSFLGTPIAPQFFLTAKHLGNLTGQSIVFSDSTSYATTAVFNDPGSDLAIYQISGTFANDKIVPLYAGSLFLNQPLAIFGRGVPRTDTVVTGSSFAGGTEAKGWTWGTGTGARSWGTNTLDGLSNLGSPGIQLRYEFDAGGGGNEGVLSLGDSGGPVFMQELPGGDWKLAGINYGVAAIFNTVGSGTGFYAAVYDTGGLYSGDTLTGPWTYEADTSVPIPAASYSTAVSLRSGWISSVISVPEPWTLGMLASACLPLLLRLRRGRVMPSGGR